MPFESFVVCGRHEYGAQCTQVVRENAPAAAAANGSRAGGLIIVLSCRKRAKTTVSRRRKKRTTTTMTDGYRRRLRQNDGEIVVRSKRREDDDINDVMRCTVAERSCTVVEVEKREKLGKKKKKSAYINTWQMDVCISVGRQYCCMYAAR
uniref:Uncharacterized protein n=2 Tax=Schizaphis graminum TaxID=13262 RepID=A0A2S2N755_SCHGA